MNRYLSSTVTRIAAFVVVSLTTLFAITVPALARVVPTGRGLRALPAGPAHTDMTAVYVAIGIAAATIVGVALMTTMDSRRARRVAASNSPQSAGSVSQLPSGHEEERKAA